MKRLNDRGIAGCCSRVDLLMVEQAVAMTKRRKRPRDPIQLAKLIGDIATGQLTPEQRAEIARVAAEARWKKSKR
jgi:hypothetical protein